MSDLRRTLHTLYSDEPRGSRPARRGDWKWLVIAALAATLPLKAFVLVHYYNSFLELGYAVREAEAQIDALLQRRRNMVMTLDATVRAYAKHETAIFEHASNTRRETFAPRPSEQAPPKPGGPFDLDGALAQITAVAERYPDLKLSENFRQFMEALITSEREIAERRMTYNTCVNALSTATGTFPGSVFAWLYDVDCPDFFQPEPVARVPPQVKY